MMQPHPLSGHAAYALVHDALLAGIETDVAEQPYIWGLTLAQPRVANPALALDISIPQLVQPQPQVLHPKPQPVAEAKASAWRLWHAGEVGGVVVVLGGSAPPEGQALQLLQAILKAVGADAYPLGFVGLEGEAPKGGLPEAMTTEVAALQPKFTLFMGQGVLAAACGKIMGVEGWHAAPQPLALVGVVGVTYPLDLLLKKPLFKGLAWQHVQRWRNGFAKA
jgi:hypothetical protein